MLFTFDQQFSIGLKSGEYGGRKMAHAPRASIASSISSALLLLCHKIFQFTRKFDDIG
jgi:hypothetical protein